MKKALDIVLLRYTFIFCSVMSSTVSISGWGPDSPLLKAWERRQCSTVAGTGDVSVRAVLFIFWFCISGRRCYHQSYLLEQTTYVVINVCILNSQRVLHFTDREGIRFMGSNNFHLLNYSSNCLKILEVPVPNETNQEHLWLVTLGVWQISFRSEKSVQELNWGHFTCSNLPLSCSWRFLSAIKRHFPLEEIVA